MSSDLDPIVIPPLLQASTTQDGYLSADDWILFSSGGIVPVTSFNLRTGEVVLLNDDVMAALGYVPTGAPMPFIQKAGDTMSGPLVLPVDPALDLEASTKHYVDTTVATSVAAGGIIGSYRVATGTTAADPGTGKVGFNTTGQADATKLFIDYKTDSNFDASDIWLMLEPGRRIAVQSRTDAS